MLDKVIYLLQQAIEERKWEIVEQAIQMIQDIEDGYYDNESDIQDDWT